MDEKLRFGIYDSTAKVVPTFVEKDTNRPLITDFRNTYGTCILGAHFCKALSMVHRIMC